MKHLQTFIEMGGYANFVWPAYGLAMIVLFRNVQISKKFKQRAQRELAATSNHS